MIRESLTLNFAKRSNILSISSGVRHCDSFRSPASSPIGATASGVRVGLFVFTILLSSLNGNRPRKGPVGGHLL